MILYDYLGSGLPDREATYAIQDYLFTLLASSLPSDLVHSSPENGIDLCFNLVLLIACY
jgi:hypothetical protein